MFMCDVSPYGMGGPAYGVGASGVGMAPAGVAVSAATAPVIPGMPGVTPGVMEAANLAAATDASVRLQKQITSIKFM